EPVGGVVGVEGAVEEEETGGQRVVEIILLRIEDALAVRPETAKRDAEREAHVIGRRLGVELGRVIGQRCALGAIDSGLRPGLGVTPRGRAGPLELDGWLAVTLMGGEVVFDSCDNSLR